MTASSTLTEFHQWLLAGSCVSTGARSLMLLGDADDWLEPIVSAVAEYLNEYDDSCDGRWLAVTRDLVGRIAIDSANQRLLGLRVGIDEERRDAATASLEVMGALCSRGHLVMAAPATLPAEADNPGVFKVGVGCTSELVERCHMTLNPDLIDPECAAHIIGDVFLEWLSCGVRSASGGQPLREDLRGI